MAVTLDRCGRYQGLPFCDTRYATSESTRIVWNLRSVRGSHLENVGVPLASRQRGLHVDVIRRMTRNAICLSESLAGTRTELLRIRRQYDCDSLICERDPGNDEAYKEPSKGVAS